MQFNVTEVANILHVNQETVRRWIREGKLKAMLKRGRGGSTISMEHLVEFVNNTSPRTPFKMLFESWCIQNNINSNTCNEIDSIDDYHEDNVPVEDDNYNQLINQEKMKLCILRQELARIQAEITIRETQIEYYNLMLKRKEK
jgi:excisionase family DNA binding protein